LLEVNFRRNSNVLLAGGVDIDVREFGDIAVFHKVAALDDSNKWSINVVVTAFDNVDPDNGIINLVVVVYWEGDVWDGDIKNELISIDRGVVLINGQELDTNMPVLIEGCEASKEVILGKAWLVNDELSSLR